MMPPVEYSAIDLFPFIVNSR